MICGARWWLHMRDSLVTVSIAKRVSTQITSVKLRTNSNVDVRRNHRQGTGLCEGAVEAAVATNHKSIARCCHDSKHQTKRTRTMGTNDRRQGFQSRIAKPLGNLGQKGRLETTETGPARFQPCHWSGGRPLQRSAKLPDSEWLPRRLQCCSLL